MMGSRQKKTPLTNQGRSCFGGDGGIRTLDTLLAYAPLAGEYLRPLGQLSVFGGSGEIRTHGAFLLDSFQDCCNKPDSATLPLDFKERLVFNKLSVYYIAVDMTCQPLFWYPSSDSN